MLTVLDLFSGIGGFSLGLERTGGFRTVAFCEQDEFCQRVLAKHWPDVPIHPDIRELTGDAVGPVDIITGGFPCQDISVAGQQSGLDGARSGLWTELLRVIGEIRPRYAIVENVPNLLTGPTEQRGRWFGRILGDLAEIGFDAEWHCIPACSVNAPHRRDRIWVVAYAKQKQWVCSIFDGNNEAQGVGLGAQEKRGKDGVRPKMGEAGCPISGKWVDKPDPERMVNGVSDWPHRLGALGNSVVPQVVTEIGHAILEAERLT